MAPATPPELNKASFLIRRDGSATTQNPVKTRQQEMTLTSATTTGQQDSSAATNTAAPPPGQSPAPLRRIPYNPDLYIPENTSIPAHWIAALYLTGRGNFAARSLLTSERQRQHEADRERHHRIITLPRHSGRRYEARARAGIHHCDEATHPPAALSRYPVG